MKWDDTNKPPSVFPSNNSRLSETGILTIHLSDNCLASAWAIVSSIPKRISGGYLFSVTRKFSAIIVQLGGLVSVLPKPLSGPSLRSCLNDGWTFLSVLRAQIHKFTSWTMQKHTDRLICVFPKTGRTNSNK